VSEPSPGRGRDGSIAGVTDDGLSDDPSGIGVPPEVAAEARPRPPRSLPKRVLDELKAVDLAVYRAVEGTPTPTLDVPLRRLSRFANHSKLWLVIAAALFAFGGRSGRRAAVTGAGAVGLNSFIVNVPLKYVGRRERPDRGTHEAVADRHVRMPDSGSFPSGHSASGFAFAQAVAASRPELGLPLRTLAAVVAYSRVHTGVHYPGDVLAGALVGMAIGEGTARASRAVQKAVAARPH
jgi:membrane-associated phospholipid phosphatase